jgi:ferritin-like metal-binding protein YciE
VPRAPAAAGEKPFAVSSSRFREGPPPGPRIKAAQRVKLHSLKDLYVDQLKDLYSAENQLVKALPKMAKAAASDDLREGFEHHLEPTKNQATRLELIFEKLDMSPKGKKCKAMEGLIEEGKEILDTDADDEVRDAALIAAAQRVEHYRTACYGCARTFATHLGDEEAAHSLAAVKSQRRAR